MVPLLRDRTLVTRLSGRVILVSLAILGLGGNGAWAQSSLDQIRARRELVIATEASYPPFEFVEKSELHGFDIELGDAIGKELGVKVQWKNMKWSGVLGSLETHISDLVMSGVTITAERKKGNAFSRPYFLSGQAIVRRKGDPRIRSPRDLIGKVVAVQLETTGQEAVQKLGLPKDKIHKFEKLQDALFDLRNTNSDAAVADLPALQDAIRKGYPELEVVGDVFVRENVGIVARRSDLDLVAAVDQALDTLMVDGRYAQIYARWIEEPVTTHLLAELDRVQDQGTAVPKMGRSLGKTTGPSSKPVATGSAFTIRWPILRAAFPWLLRGARMTLYLTFMALLLGIPAGLLIALARISSLKPLSIVAAVYVEIVRGTPLLMQIYVIYFILPSLNIHLPEMVSAIMALSLNAAAYISEIFRAGIQSIDTGQMEAARSLGMDYVGAMRWVILPQTLRRVLPPLTNEGVALLKDSSLVSVISISELMMIGTQYATNTGSPTTVYLAVALIYLTMTLPLTYLVRRLEAHWQPNSGPRVRRARPVLNPSPS
jgi:His/Glu/Gln/Arg/opine family amino acid ABC transporter permease subunit